MVRVSPKAGWLAGRLLEVTLCRWWAALLQALAKGMMPLTVVLDSLTGEYLSLAISSQVDDAEIDTKRSISGSRGRLWNLKRHSQVELPVAVEKVSLPFNTLHACLLIATNQKWNKYPTRERHEGNGIKALKGHDTLIVDNRAFRPEVWLDALITLIGFTGLADSTNNQLSRKLIGRTQLTIHELLQLKFVGRVFSKSHACHIISSPVKGVHRLKQGLVLFSCRDKLQEHRLFNASSILLLSDIVNGMVAPVPMPQTRNAAFLPVSKDRGISRRFW